MLLFKIIVLPLGIATAFFIFNFIDATAEDGIARAILADPGEGKPRESSSLTASGGRDAAVKQSTRPRYSGLAAKNLSPISAEWRLREKRRERPHGVTLFHTPYQPNNPAQADDFCEFCQKRFSLTAPGAFSAGYTTEDNRVWVREQWFGEFNQLFRWNLD
jgi:hypothetical protein